MGGVVEPANGTRTSAVPPVSPAPYLAGQTEAETAAGWTEPPDVVPDQAEGIADPLRETVHQPRRQALASLLTPAVPRPVTGRGGDSSSENSAEEAGVGDEPLDECDAQTAAARQFQLVRQLYVPPDEPARLISIIG